MVEYWSLPHVRKVIDDLIEEGLGGNTLSSEVYSLDEQIKIGGNYYYFFGDVYANPDGPPSIEVGFALEMHPEIGDPAYAEVIKKFELETVAAENRLAGLIEDQIGERPSISIPQKISTTCYPIVKFTGTDAKELMKKAKDTAEKLLKSGVQLAEWYFERKSSFKQ